MAETATVKTGYFDEFMTKVGGGFLYLMVG